MDSGEAHEMLNSHLERYRGESYQSLVSKIGQRQHLKVDAPSGNAYHIEIQILWDSKKGGTIRVIGNIDDGGLRAFLPVTKSVLIEGDVSNE